MKHYRTAAGDGIRVEFDRPGAGAEATIADDLALAVSRGADDPSVDGVLTTSAHADAIHDLFDRGERFRIVVDPADDDGTIAYEGCQLLSSSGKWTARRRAASDEYRDTE